MTGVRATGKDRQFIKASAKLFEILEFYANDNSGEGRSLGQVSSTLGYPKTTVHRLIYSLERLGYLEKERASDAYCLGPRFYALVDGKVSYGRLKTLALPIMEELVENVQETVNLGVLDQDEILLIHAVEGPSAFRWAAKAGQREQLYATAMGKAIAAFHPTVDVERLLKRKGMRRLTPCTLTQVGAFVRELRSVRRDFVAFDNEETTTGVQCVASPIFDRTLNVIAALSISGPQVRMSKQISKAKFAVRRAAQKISQLMGYHIEKPSIT